MATKKKDGSAIIHMLSSVAQYPKKAEQYKDDPDGLLKDHGVPKEQHAAFKKAFAALKDGKTGPMRKVVGEAGVHTDTCFFTIP